ncbi:MAG: 4-hydroxy-tetrahydrodipicolinate synthase [Acidimicrobiales bacterium]
MRPARFGAVVTAMVTPFDAEDRLDIDGAVTLARWLAAHGSDGLVVAGTTGEAPVLDDAERTELFRAVSEAVTVPVLAGTGTNDTRHSVEFTAAAADTGVDGVLVVTPYYNRPSQDGLVAHFTAVARSTSLPVMLYDVPFRTGRRIATTTVLRVLEATTNVVALKDAANDPVGAARLRAHAPEKLELYSGDDPLTLPLLALGAVGVVSVASHWCGTEIGEMVAAFRKGDVDGARVVNERLLESYDFVSSEAFPNPIPAKAACRAIGLPVGQCRPPMGGAPPELEGEASRVIARLGSVAGVGGPVG